MPAKLSHALAEEKASKGISRGNRRLWLHMVPFFNICLWYSCTLTSFGCIYLTSCCLSQRGTLEPCSILAHYPQCKSINIQLVCNLFAYWFSGSQINLLLIPRTIVSFDSYFLLNVCQQGYMFYFIFFRFVAVFLSFVASIKVYFGLRKVMPFVTMCCGALFNPVGYLGAFCWGRDRRSKRKSCRNSGTGDLDS